MYIAPAHHSAHFQIAQNLSLTQVFDPIQRSLNAQTVEGNGQLSI
jgi:hypothetical protein